MRQQARYLYQGALALLFFCTLLSRGLPWAPMGLPAALELAAELLPLAVVLWATGRGNPLAAAALLLGALDQISDLLDPALLLGGTAALPQVLGLLGLLLRLVVLVLFFRPGALSGYLDRRRAQREFRDWLWEGGALLLALLLNLLPEFYASVIFWREAAPVLYP